MCEISGSFRPIEAREIESSVVTSEILLRADGERGAAEFYHS